jgi:hypothetical protein
MRFGVISLLGLVFAAGLGLAAHLIARDTVALPVASIQAGEGLAPVSTQAEAPRRVRRTTTTARTRTTPTTTTTATETGDDHGGRRGRNRGSGAGGDSSGKGSSGDDD